MNFGKEIALSSVTFPYIIPSERRYSVELEDEMRLLALFMAICFAAPFPASPEARNAPNRTHGFRTDLTTAGGESELRVDLRTVRATAGHDAVLASRPLALAAADLDEDGVPDLISSYAGPESGTLIIHRGNLDAIYPFGPEAHERRARGTFTDSPFLSPARIIEVPNNPEFLGVGDFDGDGHFDVVIAERASKFLYLLPGDGKGGLGEVQEIGLPGRVTAFVTGEVNRPDGLADLVVAVGGPAGPKVLVFESPAGALRGEPESFALSANATSLVLGQLTDEFTRDLAVASGSELLIVHGRDRRISLDELRRADVLPAFLERQAMPSAITALTLGDFGGGARKDLALLFDDGKVRLLQNMTTLDVIATLGSDDAFLTTARVASASGDELLALHRAGRRMQVLKPDLPASRAVEAWVELEGEPIAVLPMRLNADALSDLVVLEDGGNSPRVFLTQSASTYTVNSTGDGGDSNTGDGVCNDGSGNCTLRAAIQQANANAGADSITFSIGTGPQTIKPGSAFPAISDSLTIDGTTQPGFAGAPIIVLDGDLAGFPATGLHIIAGPCTVRGMVVHRWLGGANGAGIHLASAGNVVEGNHIGTDVGGTEKLQNSFHGVRIDSSGNILGGTTAAARNVISGNNVEGVHIEGAAAQDNVVQGNYIGTDATGNAQLTALGGDVGVGILNAASNTVGGTSPGAGNLISGNQHLGLSGVGVNISGIGSTGNLVQGNLVGTDAVGANAVPNYEYGVSIEGSAGNTVGGTTVSARNVVSGNGLAGVRIAFVDSTANLVQGNFIGTDMTGTAAVSNSTGVQVIVAHGNTIGGTMPGAGNIISGNTGSSGTRAGIDILGGTGNQVQGNLVGTDAAGAAALSNLVGVQLRSGADANTIGGTTAGAANVISGNQSSGLQISAEGNQVQGNLIGTDTTGTAALGNDGAGVSLFSVALDNTIGGTANGEGNTVAFNGLRGVNVSGADANGNAILSNSIHSNDGLGIALTYLVSGVTPNDPGDIDSGPNQFQNFPDLTSTASGAGATTVKGTLNSAASTTFRVEFFSTPVCDASGHGEGDTILMSTPLSTDGAGNLVFSLVVPASVPAGSFITATATDPAGNTSEFSACHVVPDCNGNGILDALDVANSTSDDCNSNGMPDECEMDTDGDGVIDPCDNCSFSLNPAQTDVDSDGFGAVCECDDSNGDVFPLAPPICDGLNNDCLDLNYPLLFDTNEFDNDGDGVTECAGDCAPLDPGTYADAPELNDGLDNQCPGNAGYGIIDEISGIAGFLNPLDASEYSWPAQSGATEYEVTRATSASFANACTTFMSALPVLNDSTPVPEGEVLYYLARSSFPFAGSWGTNFAGVERVLPCGVESQCADGLDNDLDGDVDCNDTDCLADPACAPDVFTFTDTFADDIANTAIFDFFDGILVEPTDFLFFEIVKPTTGSSALCAAQADFYRENYLLYAPAGANVPSGAWDKWYRLPATGGSWVFDPTPNLNLFGAACFVNFSWCPESGGLSGIFRQVVHPAHPAPNCETVDSLVGCSDGTWQFTLRVGPSRLAACGF